MNCVCFVSCSLAGLRWLSWFSQINLMTIIKSFCIIPCLMKVFNCFILKLYDMVFCHSCHVLVYHVVMQITVYKTQWMATTITTTKTHPPLTPHLVPMRARWTLMQIPQVLRPLPVTLIPIQPGSPKGPSLGLKCSYKPYIRSIVEELLYLWYVRTHIHTVQHFVIFNHVVGMMLCTSVLYVCLRFYATLHIFRLAHHPYSAHIPCLLWVS